MGVLGLDESNVIFLGCMATKACRRYMRVPTPQLSTRRPLARRRHMQTAALAMLTTTRFCTVYRAQYNRQTILADFEAFLAKSPAHRRDHHVTSVFDSHPDHSATYSFLVGALIALEQEGLTKVPRVHETVIPRALSAQAVTLPMYGRCLCSPLHSLLLRRPILPVIRNICGIRSRPSLFPRPCRTHLQLPI